MVKTPSTHEEWQQLRSKFEVIGNFHNEVGAIDGKNIVIKAPSESGSLCYNYK